MMTPNDAVLVLARQALRAAEREVPRYSHARSPRTYTQHQLFALLAIRRFLGTDLRTVQELVADSPALREALGLQRAPHYSTLCYAERRLIGVGPHEALLRDLVARARQPGAGEGASDGARGRLPGSGVSSAAPWRGPSAAPVVGPGPTPAGDFVSRPTTHPRLRLS